MGSLDHEIDVLESPGDREIAELAARQHGVVARRQLTRAGLGRGAIEHRLSAGRLHVVRRGVYAVGHSVLSVHGRRIAAVLACGPGSALSHQPAADHWCIRRTSSAKIHVTTARSRHGADGIVVHRVRQLDPRDVTVKDGIPITTVARTLLDNAEVLRERQLGWMIEEAERLRLFDLNALRETCERNRGRRGIRPLIAVLGATQEVPPHSKSDLERLFLDLCREANLPAPVMNGYVEGFEVDAHWPGTNVVVELDSWGFHRTRGAFERDHDRDMKLKLAEYIVLRLTYRQLTQERAEVTATLRALLDSARTPRAPDPGARARALP